MNREVGGIQGLQPRPRQPCQTLVRLYVCLCEQYEVRRETRSDPSGAGGGAPGAGRTMQLKVPADFRADETMQLRVSDIPDIPENRSGKSEKAQKSEKPDKASRSGNRRKAPRTPFLVQLSATLGPRLAPLLAFLAPYVARLAPYARKLRPLYPRPGRTGWRRWIPSWRQSLGASSRP